MPLRLALLIASSTLSWTSPATASQDMEPVLRDELHRRLAEVVDLRTPEERRAAAEHLARREEPSLADWLDACRTFPCLGATDRGQHGVTVPLQVLSRIEETDLWLHVPRSYRAGSPAPLLVTFHGTGGSGRGMTGSWASVAEQLGMLVLAPSEAGENGGYAFSARERAAALAAIRWVRRHYDIDENRVMLTGFSRGGHLTWDLALRYPDRFAAAVPMVGGPRWDVRGGANNMRYLENVLDLPIRDLQGALDQEQLVDNVRMTFERLDELGARDAKLFEFPELGHSVDWDAVDWTEFLGGARRNPAPQRVVRRTAREGEGRAFWIDVLGVDGAKVQEEFTPTMRSSQKNLPREKLVRMLAKQAEQKTARLALERAAPNRFTGKAENVVHAEILLEAGSYDASKPIEIKVGGRRSKRKAPEDVQVLLAEFVERFDRSYLPVARVEWKK